MDAGRNLNMAETPKDNLDLIVMANLQQNRAKKKNSHTKQTATHKGDKERERASAEYFFLGKQVCRATTSSHMELVSKDTKTFANILILVALDQDDMAMQENQCIMPVQSVTREKISFISNYADYNAMPPSR